MIFYLRFNLTDGERTLLREMFLVDDDKGNKKPSLTRERLEAARSMSEEFRDLDDRLLVFYNNDRHKASERIRSTIRPSRPKKK